MPVHQTIDPFESTAKAVSALLSAIDGAPTIAAVVAYRSAIVRHGRHLLDTAGREAITAALARIRGDAPDKATGQERERIVLEAWSGLTESQEQAA